MGHDAILQIRADREITDSETRSIYNIIERYSGDADCEFLDVKKGIDLYISSMNSGRHISAKIMKVLGGSKKESTKYLRLQDGKVVYRFTIRVKLPDEPSAAKYGF
ncbi:MAG TPA: NMD3-related protein [archaeon]|nr:NMD3-related protein [archaeon]